MGIGRFELPVNAGAAPVADWTPPSDWIDISSVGDNEINLLVTDNSPGYAFVVYVSGTYSIDWGDGTIETARVSGTTYQHKYVTNGAACSDGYGLFKIRIFGATSNIWKFNIKRHTYQNQDQYPGYLWAQFGTRLISDYSNTFWTTGINCSSLRRVYIPSLQACSVMQAAFYGCSALVSVRLPETWGLVNNIASIFVNCKALTYPKLPTDWSGIMSCSAAFNGCGITYLKINTFHNSLTSLSNLVRGATNLLYLELPQSWNNISDINYMVGDCSSLTTVILPTNQANFTSMTAPFSNCYSLGKINDLEKLGSLTNQLALTYFGYRVEMITGIVTITSLLSKFEWFGTTGKLNRVTGIRLTNTGSLFTGASPQVLVSYCSMDAAALNLLFGDLPTLTGKTIDITGCTGAATCDRTIATAKGWTVTG